MIALKNDMVMPLKGIYDLMWNGDSVNSNIITVHFNYPYIHENPFPAGLDRAGDLLDDAFNHVFGLASDYLS